MVEPRGTWMEENEAPWAEVVVRPQAAPQRASARKRQGAKVTRKAASQQSRKSRRRR